MLLEDLNQAVVLESNDIADAAENMSDDDKATLESLMLEDLLLEDAVEGVCDECANTNGVTFVEEATIVKLDKQAKRNRDYKFAILSCAREANDGRVKQLMTLWKMEAFLMRGLEKKYSSKAKAKMRKTASEAKKSKTPKIAGLFEKKEKKAASHKGPNNYKPPAKLKQDTKSISNKLARKIK